MLTFRHELRRVRCVDVALALLCLPAVNGCVPDPWSPPVNTCTGPRCGPTDGGAGDVLVDATPDVAVDATTDVAVDAPPASCRAQALRGLAGSSGEFVCAIRCDGAVWCWGSNTRGELGDGTTTGRATPALVRDLGGPATAVTAGYNHVCAVASGVVRCWGRNDEGQLGDGTRGDRTRPVAVAGLERPALDVAAGGTHSCALLDDGSVWCWGANRSGQLGDGSVVSSLVPVAVRGLGGAAAAVVAGQYHSCARLVDGAVRCWGFNDFGALGDGSATDQRRPVPAALPEAAVALASKGNHGCAVLAGGALWCWGFNGDGAVDRSLTNRTRPVLVAALGTSARGVSTGDRHTCALLEGGDLRCWGLNAAGQLGDDSTTRRLTPTTVQGLDGAATLLSAGGSHTCAALADGRVRCWGSGSSGQLGTGSHDDSRVPVTVLLPP